MSSRRGANPNKEFPEDLQRGDSSCKMCIGVSFWSKERATKGLPVKCIGYETTVPPNTMAMSNIRGLHADVEMKLKNRVDIPYYQLIFGRSLHSGFMDRTFSPPYQVRNGMTLPTLCIEAPTTPESARVDREYAKAVDRALAKVHAAKLAQKRKRIVQELKNISNEERSLCDRQQFLQYKMKRNASKKNSVEGETNATSESQELQEINDIKEKLRDMEIKKALLQRGEIPDPDKAGARMGGPISRHRRIIGQETGNHEEDAYFNNGIKSMGDDDFSLSKLLKGLNMNGSTSTDKRSQTDLDRKGPNRKADNELDAKLEKIVKQTKSFIFDYIPKTASDSWTSLRRRTRADWSRDYENTTKQFSKSAESMEKSAKKMIDDVKKAVKEW